MHVRFLFEQKKETGLYTLGKGYFGEFSRFSRYGTCSNREMSKCLLGVPFCLLFVVLITVRFVVVAVIAFVVVIVVY